MLHIVQPDISSRKSCCPLYNRVRNKLCTMERALGLPLP